MSNLDKIRRKIDEKKMVLGVFVTMADCAVSEIVGYAGFDYVWIDAEHAALDRQEIYHHILAAQSAGAAAFVRVPGVDPAQVKAILDMGPDGIIFPFVETAEIAELAVRSCLYPPIGMRGQGPIRAIKYGLDDENAYIENSSAKVWKILQIENMKGYENLDAIMNVEGYDSIFVGPADLARSIQLPAAEKQARLSAILDDIGQRLAKRHIVAGSATGSSPENIQECKNRGFHWLAIAQDVRVLGSGLRDILGKNRSHNENKAI